MKWTVIYDTFLHVIRTIRATRLRSFLTIMIIALGITALVGILTSIEAIKVSLKNNFMLMGSNTFTITKISFQREGLLVRKKKKIQEKKITLEEAQDFKDRFDFPAVVSLSVPVQFAAVCKYENIKTHPNVSVYAVDENYFLTAGLEISEGRNFTKREVDGGQVAIIGNDVNNKLFSQFSNSSVIGRTFLISNIPFQIIGILKPQGSSFGFSMDNSCFVPLKTGIDKFTVSDVSLSIHVMVYQLEQMNFAIEEARGIFRNIRKLAPDHPDNFEIRKSDSIFQILLENIQYLTMAATLIGVITLIGASIGLMNIMLVSVSERTREIGVRKALGATWKDIRNQFLLESVFISQFGGLLGILLGIVVGNAIGLWLDTVFVIPWLWVGVAFLLTSMVGILAGSYPALKASKLHPIDALRYE
ncbi:MAG: ABC transporter permease [Bacteroidales bacterium]|nr:ABC transporter permease [Bacteroidales bacterium]